MNNRLVIQHLWWKELRQLVPMLVLLPTIAALLTILYLATWDKNQFSWSWSAGVAIFLGMPGLFAVGAGALLVGQEKELRTIQWLTSLPIRPETIIRIKTAAAVVGLVVLWIISGLYFVWRQAFESPANEIDQFWVWPANSLFILLAGLALAWKNKSAWVALLLVVPIAVVPYVLAVVVHRLLGGEGSVSKDPSAVTVIAVQLICSAVALFFVERIGRRALSPERVHTTSSYWPFGRAADEVIPYDGLPSPSKLATDKDVRRTSGRFLSAARLASHGERRGETLSASYGVTQAPLPALIWQFALQSRALLIGTSVMLVFASVVFLALNDPRPDALASLAILLPYLATSWLGASVFQSDTAHQRIRFLADRGVSPKLVWLTRQAVPITIILTIAIATLLFAILIEPLRLRSSPGLGTMAMLALASLFVVFSFSQWVGQVINSPIVSMITAPLLSLIPFSAYSVSVNTFNAPLVLVAIAAFLPFLATFLSTRRWMDRRFGKRYWFMQAGYAAAIFLLPAMPHIAALIREPGMSRQVGSQMNTVATSSRSFMRDPVELVLNRDTNNENSFESFVESWNEQLDSIESQLNETSLPVGISSQRVVQNVFAINLLVGMSLEQKDSTVANEHLELYRRSLMMLSDIVFRMRTSPRIVDQDFADSIEIAMVRQMRGERTESVLGEERYRLIATRLADSSTRREARIRAVALSWSEYEELSKSGSFASYDLGGYVLEGGGDGWDVRNGKALMNRRVARRAQHLWELANFNADEVPQELLLKVASDWGKSPSEYGLGSIANHYRIDNVVDSLGGILNNSRSVANQWYAGWEDQARELLNAAD